MTDNRAEMRLEETERKRAEVQGLLAELAAARWNVEHHAAAGLLALIAQSDAFAEQHAEGRIVNAWVCERCGRQTVGRHRDRGVTPFMVRCRASFDPSTGRPCQGTAMSLFYRVTQEPNVPAHVEFYRPKDVTELVATVSNAKSFADSVAIAMHLAQGGTAMRHLDECPIVKMPWGTRARQA